MKEYSTLERGVIIGRMLENGQRFNPQKIMDMFDLSLSQAYRIMRQIEIAAPVSRHGVDVFIKDKKSPGR